MGDWLDNALKLTVGLLRLMTSAHAQMLFEEEKGFEPLNRYKRLVVFKTTALSQLCHSSLVHPLIVWVLFCCYPTTAERVRLTIRSSEYATESCPLKGSILHLPWICKPHGAKVQTIPIFCKYFGAFLKTIYQNDLQCLCLHKNSACKAE